MTICIETICVRGFLWNLPYPPHQQQDEMCSVNTSWLTPELTGMYQVDRRGGGMKKVEFLFVLKSTTLN